jgi:hypothetical protein
MKPCAFPLTQSFVEFLSACHCFLYGKLCDLQIDFLKIQCKHSCHYKHIGMFCWKHGQNTTLAKELQMLKEYIYHKIKNSCKGGQITPFIRHIGNNLYNKMCKVIIDP